MFKGCIIDKGVFKYIQIACKMPDGSQQLVVRGWADCPYHADVLEKFDATENQSQQCQLSCPGGGRIEHDVPAKKIKIFGYSQGFGRCDHAETQRIVQQDFPDYEVTWSNEGY